MPRRYQSEAAQRAKALLVHYFTLAGAVRDGDNIVEIEEAVDYLIDAAVDESRAEAEAPDDLPVDVSDGAS